jgi:hypothetical protein
VKLKDIIGVYTGTCVGGKANGTGKSVGTDQYEGQFKDGYPDGKGTYTWQDRHYFTGSYKKGKKEGKGDMYYKTAHGTDSVITGFWKKDKYVGEFEDVYKVISKTTRITKVDCNLVNEKGEDISITLHRLGGTSSNNAVPYITSISSLQGTFYTKNNQELSNVSITKVIGVTFPFKAVFYLSNDENIEILFNSKGDYDVSVDILY